MSECKVKLSVDICGESALDAVTTLVVNGMSVNKACKQVAEDFNKTNDGAAVKANTLRQAYKRAQKVGTCTNSTNEKLGHVPTKKKLVPLDVPIINNSTIDTTKYITIEEHIALIAAYEKACTEDSERLMKKIHELEEELRLLKESCVAPAEILIEQAEISTLIPRQMVFEFIQKKGTEFQVMALKDESLPNEKLWKVFLKVREQYKASTPPPAWDKIIVNATGIE